MEPTDRLEQITAYWLRDLRALTQFNIYCSLEQVPLDQSEQQLTERLRETTRFTADQLSERLRDTTLFPGIDYLIEAYDQPEQDPRSALNQWIDQFVGYVGTRTYYNISQLPSDVIPVSATELQQGVRDRLPEIPQRATLQQGLELYFQQYDRYRTREQLTAHTSSEQWSLGNTTDNNTTSSSDSNKNTHIALTDFS